MKIVLSVLLLAVAAVSAEDLVETASTHPRCVIGERGTFNGTIFADNAAVGTCYDPDSSCAIFTYDLITDMGVMKWEYGTCMSNSAMYGCDELGAYLNKRGFGNVTECNMRTVASGSEEFNPTPAEGCDARAEEDLHVYPSCTMRQVLIKMNDCAASYQVKFPYTDAAECASEVDMIFKCYGEVAQECYSGRCPTIFDDMPGAREWFSKGRDWSFGVEGVDSALNNMVAIGLVNDTTGYKDMILEASCSPPGEIPAFLTALPEMLNSSAMAAMFDETTMAIFAAIPCSEAYYNKIGEAYLSAVTGFYSAMTHEGVCEAFNEYKSTVSRAFLMECDLMSFSSEMFSDVLPEEVQPFVETMMRAATIWGEYFTTYNLPGCNKISANYTSSCVTGDRIFVNGTVYEDNTVNTLCPNLNDMCLDYDYTVQSGYDTIRVVGGACRDPYLLYDCEAITNYTVRRGFGAMKSCAVQACAGSYCNDLEATPPTGCSLIKANYDVQLYPGCSAQETMTEFFTCYEQFYTNFPYDTQDQCRNQQSHLFECLSRSYDKCLSGRCPTVLDMVPGMRSGYPLVRDLMHDVSSIEEVVERMWAQSLVDEATGMQIIQYVNMFTCPEMKDLPTMVEEWFMNFNMTMVSEWLVSMDINLVDLQAAMPCSMKYYTSIAGAYQTMIGEFFHAEDRSDMCTAYDAYFASVTASFNENCDASKFEDFLKVLMPESLHELVPYVMQACEYVGKTFYENPTLPMCRDDSSTDGGHTDGGHVHIEVKCDHLYESTSKCGMKKAWLCDYAKWKADFLGNWLQDYANYKHENMMEVDMENMPPCYKMSDYRNLCRNGARKMECFQIPIIDCPMCMCSDHEYNDLSGLTTFWRDDYRMWQKFFAAYRMSYNSGSSSHNSHETCDV